MKTVSHHCTVVAAFVFALAFPAATAHAQIASEAFFPTVPGSTWTYRQNGGVTSRTVTITHEAFSFFHGSVARKFLSSDGVAEYISSDSFGIRLHGEDDPAVGVLVFDPPFRIARALTSVGDTVKTSGDLTRNGAFQGIYSGTSTTLAIGEFVTTPGGRFSTVKVQRTLILGTPVGVVSDTSIVWLAEGVGIVREEDSLVGTAELVSSNRLPAVVSAVLPVSRSAVVESPVTVFATMINAGPSPATGCGVALSGGAPAGLSLLFQTTDTVTNQVIGVANAPVDLAVGQGQSFVLALTPSAPFNPVDLQFGFDCENSPAAGLLMGINSLQISASATPVPDVIALVATVTSDGIVNIPGVDGVGAFAVAAVNVGADGAITVSTDTGGVELPVALTVCETNPARGGICLQPAAGSVTTAIANGATPTFGIFVSGTGSAVAFNPAVNRVFVRFREGGAGGIVRGATSVAVRTQ